MEDEIEASVKWWMDQLRPSEDGLGFVLDASKGWPSDPDEFKEDLREAIEEAASAYEPPVRDPMCGSRIRTIGTSGRFTDHTFDDVLDKHDLELEDTRWEEEKIMAINPGLVMVYTTKFSNEREVVYRDM